MIPILLKPKLLALRNRWRGFHSDSNLLFRDLVLLLFAFSIMLAIFWGTVAGLQEVRTFSHLVYLSPFTPLAILFLLLFVMLLISATVTALGTLYLGQDLDLLLSAPVTAWCFYIGKFSYVLYSTIWMPFVFIIPFAAAYGYVFGAGWSYYCITLLALIPYFVIPIALAMLGSTLFAIAIPMGRTREVLVVVVVLLLSAIFGLAELVSWGASGKNDMGEVLEMLHVISMPDALWLPSHWLAITLRDSLELGGAIARVELVLLYSFAIALVSISFIVVSVFHGVAFTRASNHQHGARLLDRILGRRFQPLAAMISPSFRGIALKEVQFFVREVTQAVQLVLLAGVYLIYLYNLRIFRGLETLTIQDQIMWRAFIFVMNVAMGAFVTTAVCTRFVFPSLSLEGRAIWVVLTSPLSVRRLMKYKFWMWYLPVGALSGVVFASGTLAIGAEGWEIALNFVAGWIISLGIVGLAIGLGALFANFDWEHASQLAASFGSLVFMLLSTVLIAINMVPVGILAYGRKPGMFGSNLPDSTWYSLSVLLGVFILCLNAYAYLAAMRIGRERLSKRIEES